MSDDNGNEPLRISVDEAKARTDAEGSTIVDVDDPESFAHRDHKIAGSRRIDPRDIADAVDELPEDRAVLAYCT